MNRTNIILKKHMASYVIGGNSYFEIRESIQKHPLSTATKEKNNAYKVNIN